MNTLIVGLLRNGYRGWASPACLWTIIVTGPTLASQLFATECLALDSGCWVGLRFSVTLSRELRRSAHSTELHSLIYPSLYTWQDTGCKYRALSGTPMGRESPLTSDNQILDYLIRVGRLLPRVQGAPVLEVVQQISRNAAVAVII
jgi:hypothetical protein